MARFFRSSTVHLVQVYLAGQLGHLSGQIDVWAVGQRTSTAGLLPRFVTVADLKEMRSNNNRQTGAERIFGLQNLILSFEIVFHSSVMFSHSIFHYFTKYTESHCF